MESQADGAAQQVADPGGFNPIEMATRIRSLVAFSYIAENLKILGATTLNSSDGQSTTKFGMRCLACVVVGVLGGH